MIIPQINKNRVYFFIRTSAYSVAQNSSYHTQIFYHGEEKYDILFQLLTNEVIKNETKKCGDADDGRFYMGNGFCGSECGDGLSGSEEM